MYPSEQTAVTELGESGDTAEACFTQLLNAGIVDDEEVFWSRENAVIGTVDIMKPDLDGLVTSGENAWGYVSGLTTSSDTSQPIIFDASTSPGVFDSAVWDGESIVAKLDGSVQSLKINISDGGPFNDDGSSKHGPVIVKREGKLVDIFESLPEGTTVLVPEM